VAAERPFTGPEWARDGDTFTRTGTGDRWAYSQEQELWKWACADDQWKAILGAVPEALLAHADLDAAREEFNQAGSDYLALIFYHRARFAKSSPVKAWRKRREHIIAAMLNDKQATNLSYRYHLKEALYFANAAIAAFEMQGSAHKSRKSPERDWLHSRLLSIWKARFNGKLTTGRPSAAYAVRVANSPAVRFLLAVLAPILRDDMIGAEAADKIVKAENERRKRLPEKAESWAKGLRTMRKRNTVK
jgi:hypothetical protein